MPCVSISVLEFHAFLQSQEKEMEGACLLIRTHVEGHLHATLHPGPLEGSIGKSFTFPRGHLMGIASAFRKRTNAKVFLSIDSLTSFLLKLPEAGRLEKKTGLHQTHPERHRLRWPVSLSEFSAVLADQTFFNVLNETVISFEPDGALTIDLRFDDELHDRGTVFYRFLVPSRHLARQVFGLIEQHANPHLCRIDLGALRSFSLNREVKPISNSAVILPF